MERELHGPSQVVDGVEQGFRTYKEFLDKFNVAFQLGWKWAIAGR